MLNLFQKSAVGLDLSDLSLKLVQLKEKGGRLQLVSCLRKVIPPGLIDKGEIKNEEELTETLRVALSEVEGEPLKNNQVACNLPEEKVFVRIIQLPLMKKEEVAQAVEWEIEAHIPLPVDDVYLDWQIIQSPGNSLDHFDVLIAAAPKNLVDSYVNVLKKSGLKILALEPESVAVARGLIKEGEADKPIMIVDIGASGSNFVIFSSSAVRFSSHLAVSGQVFVSTIMEKLAVPKAEAEKLKISMGLKNITKIRPGVDRITKKSKVYNALEPIIDDLAGQIQEYIDFYRKNILHVHGQGEDIAQILLCGGDSLLNNLPDVLSKKINLPVALGNPLINIDLALHKKMSVLSDKKVLAYTTAIGLALRN